MKFFRRDPLGREIAKLEEKLADLIVRVDISFLHSVKVCEIPMILGFTSTRGRWLPFLNEPPNHF